MQSVFVYQGDYNTSFFEEANNADEELIYFTILVHSDWNSSGSTMVSSRNHPVYLAQSSIDIDEERTVKWIAVHENQGEKDLAIVNMKHFDLTKGRLIVVFPKEDGSLRFKQVAIKQMNIADLKRYIEANKRELCSES